MTLVKILWAGGLLAAASWPATATPAITVLETKVISHDAQYYHGWPTVARRANGELWVAWSGGREAHICPFGQVQAMTSRDDGATWSWPRVLLDSAIDDRDAGVLETVQGTLLVTTFTSLAYEPLLKKQAALVELSTNGWKSAGMKPEQFARWKACHERLNDAERKAELGQWLIRSADGGKTWSTRLPSPVNSPHGPIQLRDGRLLYAGKELWATPKRVGACESADDGRTWRWLAEIPARAGETCADYVELHAVEAASGRLLVQARGHGVTNKFETLQAESDDGGKTWTALHSIGVWGAPSHLLRLRDGRLLMTYGYRRPPFGNQARVSADEGRTWSEPLFISRDAANGDLGYPSTVELDDGTLLTIWYEQLKDVPKAVLRQVRWRLE